MKNTLYIFLLLASFSVGAQNDIVKKIVDEANNNSQLEVLAHELLDVVGPRLTGTPQMKTLVIGRYKDMQAGELMLEFTSLENGKDGKEVLHT